MPKFQKQPTIADVAARRNQTVADLLVEWAVQSQDDLEKRCKREGVSVPTDLALSVVKPQEAPKNALVELPKKPAVKSDVKSDKKIVKGKVTLDESVASDQHDGVDPVVPAGPEDPA